MSSVEGVALLWGQADPHRSHIVPSKQTGPPGKSEVPAPGAACKVLLPDQLRAAWLQAHIIPAWALLHAWHDSGQGLGLGVRCCMALPACALAASWHHESKGCPARMKTAVGCDEPCPGRTIGAPWHRSSAGSPDAWRSKIEGLVKQ